MLETHSRFLFQSNCPEEQKPIFIFIFPYDDTIQSKQRSEYSPFVDNFEGRVQYLSLIFRFSCLLFHLLLVSFLFFSFLQPRLAPRGLGRGR